MRKINKERTFQLQLTHLGFPSANHSQISHMNDIFHVSTAIYSACRNHGIFFLKGGNTEMKSLVYHRLTFPWPFKKN